MAATMRWKIYPAHSAIDFSVRYLVARVHGRFTGLQGQVVLRDFLWKMRHGYVQLP